VQPKQRAATLKACPTCLAAISPRSLSPRSEPVGFGMPCCCSWLSSLQCLHSNASVCPLHHHHHVSTACGFIPSSHAYWDSFAHILGFSGKTIFHTIKPVPACVVHMQTLWVDPYNGLKTHQNDIIFDRGMSFEAACRKLEHEKGADDSSGFRRSRRPIFGKTMFLLALQKVGTPGVFSICRPNTGTSFFDMEV